MESIREQSRNENRQDLVAEQEGWARPMSRPQQGTQALWGISLLREDLAGDQVLEGKMVSSVLGMKLEMPAGHPGRRWIEGVGGQRKVPKYCQERLQGRRGARNPDEG